MVIEGGCRPNSIDNRIPADHRREPRSLPGRWRWCDRPWLCELKKASALHTLIHQRHPTPSCGGHAPTAERTLNPARTSLESLDRRPGIREQPGSKPTALTTQVTSFCCPKRFGFTNRPVDGLWQLCFGPFPDSLAAAPMLYD